MFAQNNSTFLIQGLGVGNVEGMFGVSKKAEN